MTHAYPLHSVLFPSTLQGPAVLPLSALCYQCCLLTVTASSWWVSQTVCAGMGCNSRIIGSLQYLIRGSDCLSITFILLSPTFFLCKFTVVQWTVAAFLVTLQTSPYRHASILLQIHALLAASPMLLSEAIVESSRNLAADQAALSLTCCQLLCSVRAEFQHRLWASLYLFFLEIYSTRSLCSMRLCWDNTGISQHWN